MCEAPRECNRVSGAGKARKRLLPAILAILFSFLFGLQSIGAAPLSIAQQWIRMLPGDIVYTQINGYLGSSPVRIFTARVPMDNANLFIRPILGRNLLGNTESVVSMARRTNAVVAVNGSFFDRHSSLPIPIGFLMVNGRTVYFSHTYRSAFGITRDNRALFGFPRTQGIIYIENSNRYFYLNGMNRARKKNDTLVYTAEYGASTRTNDSGREIVVIGDTVVSMRYGNSPIPTDGYVISMQGNATRYFNWVKRGEKMKLYFFIDRDWMDVQNALSGGPLLLQNGRVALYNYRDERFSRSLTTRIPITAIGSTYDGHLLFVVVDGRRKGYSVGMNYIEIAQFMAYQGCVSAIGMDGGGSSTMVVGGQLMNKPSDGAPRPVSNAIGVFYK